MLRALSCAALSVTFCAVVCGSADRASAAGGESATVLFADRTVKLERTLPDGDNLWVTPADLTRINRFELKPQGVCLDELCVPIGRQPADGFLRNEQGQEYFNLSKLAGKLKQAIVCDQEHGVWSLGPLPTLAAARSGDKTEPKSATSASTAVDSFLAPDFALPDRQGKLVHLSDFRDKKVLIVTWASW